LEETCGVGYTLSVQSKADRERAVKSGVTISEMGFVDPFYAYYDSKLLSRRNPNVAKDHMEKEVAEYRRLGLKILAVYPPTLQGEVYEKHPDWRRISSKTTDIPQVDLKLYPHGGMLCPLGPYGDFFIDVLAEVTEKFKVDAWSFDGLHYGGVCYCEHCRKNYLEETKKEIPAVNLHDAEFRRYQHWADRRMENLIQRMQTRLKGIKPDVALVTWTTNAGRFGHLMDIPRNMPARMNLLLDAPDQEFWLDETNRGATVVPAFANAYIWALTNHRVAFSEPYLMSHGNPYGRDSFPAHEIQRRMLLSASYGVSPSIAIALPQPQKDGVYEAMAEVQKRKPWLLHKSPEPWAALVMSDNSRVFYGREPGKVEERYLSSVLGAFRAGLEEHLPTTVLCDWNLVAEDLAKYKVIILPNTACLDERQVKALRDYVAGGGGLVASLDASLCDEFGTPREDFALADVFGVSRNGVAAVKSGDEKTEQLDENFARTLSPEYWEKRKNIFDLLIPAGSPFDEPRIRKLIGQDPVTFKGPLIPVKLTSDKAKVIATVATRTAGPVQQPAVIAHEFGKGRVVYFAAGIDAANYAYAYPYQRLMLSRAVEWAAGGSPPIRVTAPMCVHSNVFRQRYDGKERLLIHLYNDVNTTAFHALPGDDVPLREEVLPIHDIRVKLSGYKVKNIRQEPEGKKLRVEDDKGSHEVVVPKLEVHSILVVELE
ncbi:MAG: beta-galactosidase trimerization domain-containing protein, partial [Planctomycetales bacterium]|nr:beta-galactosidase trimerization domain-containing protein [Planctomycetales bacterium]